MTLMDRRRALMGVKNGGGRLPSEYQEVEWIANSTVTTTGGPAINTNINAKLNTKISCGMQQLRTGGNVSYPAFFGCMDPKCVFTTRIGHISKYVSFGNITDSSFNFDLTTDIFNIEMNKTAIKINGSTKKTYDASSLAENQNSKIYIFARGTSAGSYERQCGAKCSYFKIYEGENLVFDGVPCYRKADNVNGMYDLVSNSFLTAVGGTLTKGADV